MADQDQDIKQIVKDRYGKAALAVATGESSCCAGSACCGSGPSHATHPITSNLYTQTETATLPADAVAASLGCGNPTALAELALGETVLDLGSGGGIDVLLSARRVGPTGKAFGLSGGLAQRPHSEDRSWRTGRLLTLVERRIAESTARVTIRTGGAT